MVQPSGAPESKVQHHKGPKEYFKLHTHTHVWFPVLDEIYITQPNERKFDK